MAKQTQKQTPAPAATAPKVDPMTLALQVAQAVLKALPSGGELKQSETRVAVRHAQILSDRRLFIAVPRNGALLVTCPLFTPLKQTFNRHAGDYQLQRWSYAEAADKAAALGKAIAAHVKT